MDEATTAQPGHDEVIQPARVELAGRAAAPGPQTPGRRGPALAAWIVLALLLVLAMGVVFVLPNWVADREQEQAAEPAGSVESVVAAPPIPALSPEELARLRAEAEALLADLLPQQARLQALSAESWGGEDWTVYDSSAKAGDDAYLAETFQDAVASYARALEVGEALLGRSVNIIGAALEAGTAALDAGNSSVAQQQFSLVLGIEPESEAARIGLERAEQLPDVLALVQRADALSREGSLQEAAALYREALAIDSAWQPAREALGVVEGRIQARRFESLMSEAFTALASEDYEEANERFTAALKLRPGSEDAANGRLQAEQGQRLDQIALVEARAAAFERRELWARAIEQYEMALAEDATLIFAQEGVARAQARADLDSKLSHLLSNPNLLFDDGVLADAELLLSDAQAMAEPGPRLAEQTDELGRLIRLASTPMAIELESDELTEVTVYRVGPLGVFAQTTLELRPGTYTAIGSRDGFRDVRTTFTILPGQSLAPIRVACSEPI